MTGRGGERHALIVATAKYTDPKLQQLRAPAADAERLAAVLRDPDKGGFEVEIVADEAHGMVIRRIARFFRDRRPQDLLLLHFSCHGVKDDRGELYLAATDTEVDLLSATGISAAWLNDQINRTRSKSTVVLLDCCFSGSFPFGMRARAGSGVDAPEQLQGRGRAIITASSAMEYAYEGDELTGEGQPSIFTDAVVRGLETGEADLDQDRLVSVDDLYSYVYDKVKDATPSQTPNKKSDLQGPLYLARSTYRAPVEPGSLDPDLLSSAEDRYAGVREGAVQELAALLGATDQGVAAAARDVLERMTHDDSRRVAASAKAALGHDPGQTQPAPPPVAPAPSAPSERPAPNRRPAWLAAGAGVAAVVAVVAVVAGGGEDPKKPSERSSSSGGIPTVLLDAVPAALRERCVVNKAERWMIGHDATKQVVCSPSPYLTYGLWSSPGAAEASLPHIRHPEAVDCRRIDDEVTSWPLGNALCEVFLEKTDDGVDPGVAIWWQETDSRVIGYYSPTRDPDAEGKALREWREVAPQ